MQTGKHPSFLLAILLCGCVCTQASAHSGHPQHRAHQHGVAELQVAVDGPSLVVRLDSPLDNLLGFERAPRSDQERAAAEQLLARLKAGERVVTPTAAAGCTLASVEVVAPVLQGGAGGDGHADLTAEWRFQCREPARLSGLRVELFAEHPRLKRLDATVAGPRGQKVQRLTARMPDLVW